MKKKGLIISTVVMVVVLIAALTTTTFAWFSADANATIDTIELGAKSATSMDIGVSERTITTAPKSITTDVRNGQGISWSTDKWTGGTTGLGPNIQFELSSLAALEKAVSVAPAGKAGDVEEGNFFKAFKAADSDTYENPEAAKPNEDYFDATFVVMPTKAVKQGFVKITVTANDPANIGMAAAIHFAFYIGDKLFKVTTGATDTGSEKLSVAESVSAFDGLQYSDGWAITGSQTGTKNDTYGTSVRAEGSATWTYYLPIITWKASPADNTDYHASYVQTIAKVVRILAWIEGTDDSCVNETTSTGGKIDIEFVSFNEQQTCTKGNVTAAGD